MAEPSITCPVCGMTSYNENDIEQGYCGNCHQWHKFMDIAEIPRDWKPGPPKEPGAYWVFMHGVIWYVWVANLDHSGLTMWPTLADAKTKWGRSIQPNCCPVHDVEWHSEAHPPEAPCTTQ
tara:strand:- start:187 stop:549 length:363 start_codon:yes stop_codon:yes gene_type:complete